jgi:hypothetical protein
LRQPTLTSGRAPTADAEPTAADATLATRPTSAGHVPASACSPALTTTRTSQADQTSVQRAGETDDPKTRCGSDRPRATSQQRQCAPRRQCRPRSCAIARRHRSDTRERALLVARQISRGTDLTAWRRPWRATVEDAVNAARPRCDPYCPRAPSVPLLLCCLQDSVAWLAPGASTEVVPRVVEIQGGGGPSVMVTQIWLFWFPRLMCECQVDGYGVGRARP